MICLFLLSADFGEYAAANVLSRGQPFETRFALPAPLAAYASGFPVYKSPGDIERIVDGLWPDIVVLASGYLYAINGLFGPQALAELITRLRKRGIAVATTDPWLRIWKARPEARFTIRSIRQDGVDAAAQSRKVLELQRRLEGILGELPHLFAVPCDQGYAAFNPRFASVPMERGREWLFVLSREDFALAANAGFFDALEARVRELLAAGNFARFIAPPSLARFVEERFGTEPRVAFSGFTGFADFEAAIRQARVVAYWNVLSASLLYCLYYGVAPVFFGQGHQARVCEGLYEHAVQQVYCGQAPQILDLAQPLAGGEFQELAELKARYARLPATAEVLERLCRR